MRKLLPIGLALFAVDALVPVARAAPVVSPLARLCTGQMSFGLNLTGSEHKKKRKHHHRRRRRRYHHHRRARRHHHEREEAPANPEVPNLNSPSTSPSPNLGTGSSSSSTPSPNLTAPPKPAKPAPTMSFQAVDVTGKSAQRQKLDGAIALFKKQKYADCALAVEEITKDPANANLVPEATYLLGKALYRMGLYHSALAEFDKVLAVGPQSKFFNFSLEWLFYIAHKTVNEEIILDQVAKYSNYPFPKKFQSEFHYLLAKYHFERGRALNEAGRSSEAQQELDAAMKLVTLFPRSDPFYGKAKYLEALVDFDEHKDEAAREAFQEVVKANNPRLGKPFDEHLRELAFMQLARIRYGARQNRYAIWYYSRIPPGSDQWLESLFESSWAHFRIGEYEKALGNMITLQAPFFRDEYFPEALILKAVIYYENCRYKQARAVLQDFQHTYGPVQAKLKSIMSKGEASNVGAQHYFDVLENIEKNQGQANSGHDVVLARVLKLALTDHDLKATNASILEIEHEMDAYATKPDSFRFSDTAKQLLTGLKAERARLIQRAGLIAKAKLQKEYQYLTDLLGQALRIQFETTTKEKEVLENSLQANAKRAELKRYRWTTAVKDDQEYWPYQGEYWRDELGTYEYQLTKGCKAFKQVGGGGD